MEREGLQKSKTVEVMPVDACHLAGFATEMRESRFGTLLQSFFKKFLWTRQKCGNFELGMEHGHKRIGDELGMTCLL